MGASPGLRLGERYELVSPIASGGMAQVWLARDLVLDREVAAKVLHPHLATDEAFLTRFQREAVAAARLSHRSIVSIYDTISIPGLEAIVMELIEGRTLRAVLDDAGALPVADVADIGAQIADALDEAHRAGIVHRDIKPANIMITDTNRVLVTDFGIAKAGTDADLTTTGTLLGTAKYLSPEQVTGDRVDPRSDLYALGVVLFEALTGVVPFKANTDAATALARLHQDPPPVRSLRPNVPPGLDGVILRLMARSVDQRFQRASSAREALRNVDLTARPEPVAADPTTISGFGSTFDPSGGVGGGEGANPTTISGRPTEPPPSRGATVSGGARSSAGTATRAPTPFDRPQPPEPPPDLIEGPPLHPGVELVGIEPPRQSERLSEETVSRSGRSRLAAGATVVLLGVGVVVAVALLTDLFGRRISTNQFDVTGPNLTIASVTSFDPQTNDREKIENEDLVGFAIDGDPNTGWRTETYGGPKLAGLKSGVGLLITLEESTSLEAITLNTNTEGWAADVYVGEDFSEDEAQWGPPAASISSGSLRVVSELDGAEGQIVLLWIRDTGLSGNEHRFELHEVTIS